MFGKIFQILFYTAFIVGLSGFIARYSFDISYLPLNVHSRFPTSSNIALDGYDMIDYFSKKKAGKGMLMFSAKATDFNWLFTSPGNAKKFKANPEKFVPQFGGYCSYFISKNIAYPADPKIWHMYKGKLYFFSSEERRHKFVSEWSDYYPKAYSNWNP